jgi:hypothetical protein
MSTSMPKGEYLIGDLDFIVKPEFREQFVKVVPYNQVTSFRGIPVYHFLVNPSQPVENSRRNKYAISSGHFVILPNLPSLLSQQYLCWKDTRRLRGTSYSFTTAFLLEDTSPLAKENPSSVMLSKRIEIFFTPPNDSID